MKIVENQHGLFWEDGTAINIVDSATLCAVLKVSKPATLIQMARRGDLPPPIYLNTAGRRKKGRNMVRWNLPEVLTRLGLDPHS